MHLLGVSAHPNSPWVTQLPRNFASNLENAGCHFGFLVRDRDTKFAPSFDAVLALSVSKPQEPRSPRLRRTPSQSGSCEPFVRSASPAPRRLANNISMRKQHLEALLV